MKKTAKRLGRRIVVDGVKYRWKVTTPVCELCGYACGKFALMLVVNTAQYGAGTSFSRSLPFHHGEKQAVTPGLVAKLIQEENASV